MNWEEIRKDCPKAYKLYDLRFEISALSDYYGAHHPNQRALYDFFDDRELFIEVVVYNASIVKGGLHFNTLIWNYYFSSALYESPDCDNRIEAETMAFNKAFEILEKRL